MITSLESLHARAALLRVKRAVLDDPESAPWGGRTTAGAGLMGLGLPTAIGGGLAAGAAHGGINFLQGQSTFAPTAVQRAGQFSRVLEAPTPAARLTRYVDYGSAMAGAPLMRSGRTGAQFMENLYANPLFRAAYNAILPNDQVGGRWTPARAQHYSEFAAGPARAQAHLAREYITDPGVVRGLVYNDIVPPTAALDQGTHGLVEKLRQRLVAQGRLEPNAPFEWWKNDAYRRFFQPRFDRADAAAQQARAAAEATAARVSAAGDAGDVMRRQLYRFARQDPEGLSLLRQHGARGVQGLEQMPHDAQVRLLDMFNTRSGVGRGVVQSTEQGIREAVGRYNMLGPMARPDKVINALVRRLRGIRGGAGIVGLAGLGAAGLGTGLYLSGRGRDVAQAAQRNQTGFRELVEALRGTQGEQGWAPGQVTPALAPSSPADITPALATSPPADIPPLSLRDVLQDKFRHGLGRLASNWWQGARRQFGG